MNNRKLVLENGQIFYGIGFGSSNEVVSEIIFNTAVVGYQEILSDPTNCDKIVCMTYPLIGNYGLTDEDYESKHICMKGMIVREYNDEPSNFRYTRTLGEVMEESGVCGISGIDTRYLMKVIRRYGVMKALICDINKPLNECMDIINNYEEAKDLVSKVTSKKVWYSRTPNPKYNIAVIDLGTKINLIKKLNDKGCNVISFPYNVTKEEILKYKPDGLFISNGPSDANNLLDVVKLIKSFIGVLPIFGVSLGHQLIALAYGLKVIKMKSGHHGGNYPVKNVLTEKVEITTQNHLYTVLNDEGNFNGLKITHINVIDQDIEGFIDEDNNVMSVQFEPGMIIDGNSEDVFMNFLKLIEKHGGVKRA